MTSEQRTQVPIEEQLCAALRETHLAAISQLEAVGKDTIYENFLNAYATFGLMTFYGSKRHDEDMDRAGEHVTQVPFGIEMNTLTPGFDLVLYPEMIFIPKQEDIEEANKLGIGPLRTEGPQAMLYV